MVEKTVRIINGEKVDYPNPDDYDNHFWRQNYFIRITEQGMPFIVNADYEQCAIDEIIDYCEEVYPGLVNTYQELIEEGYTDTEIEEFISGGNHEVYLNTYHITIEEVI